MKKVSFIFLGFVLAFFAGAIEAQNTPEGTPATTSRTSQRGSPAAQPSPSFPTPLPLQRTQNPPERHEKNKYNRKVNVGQPSAPTLDEPGLVEHAPMVDQSAVIDQVIRDQLKALNEGDPSHAYYAYGSAEFKKSVSLEEFRQYVKLNRILIVHRSIEIGKPTFQGIVAKVKAKLTSGSEVARVEYELVLEDGFWKVNRLDVYRNGP